MVLRSLDEEITLDKRKNHTIEVVVDRLLVKPGIEKRLEASIDTATKLAGGLVVIAVVNGDERLYSRKLACTECGMSLPVLEPRSFSFNSKYGACEECQGLGSKWDFDPAKFGWLGSMEQFTPIAAVWHTTPIYSADDLLVHPINVGGSGPGSTTSGYPHSLNAILGTKMKVISGYPGSAEINLAIERGELDGVASWCWTCLKGQKPHWVASAPSNACWAALKCPSGAIPSMVRTAQPSS